MNNWKIFYWKWPWPNRVITNFRVIHISCDVNQYIHLTVVIHNTTRHLNGIVYDRVFGNIYIYVCVCVYFQSQFPHFHIHT